MVEAEAFAQASALQLAPVEHRQVNEFGLIDYNNMPFGPLPSELIGQQVELRAIQEKLNVYHNGRMVASYILDDELI